jgi:acyl transferase domain-containing protein
VEGTAAGRTGVVFVFPGHGAQWAGMAARLYEASAVFRDRLDECARAFAPHVDWSVVDVARGLPGAPSMDRLEVMQPALFSVMVSLAHLWRSHGVSPAAVVGHSQGEIAAAYVVGALSLEDAAAVVALRAQALATLVGHGGMTSVSLPVEQVRERLTSWGDQLCVGAVNAPALVTVSGELDALEEFERRCVGDGVRVRRIVDCPSPSAQAGKIRERLRGLLAGVRPRSVDTPFLSTVTGTFLDTAELDGDYWYRNLRQCVELDLATRTLIQRGDRLFVEVSPHPVLALAVQESAEAAGGEVVTIGSLRRDDGGLGRFVASLAQAHVHGAAVDWRPVFPGARRVDLPTYAFQRHRYWLDPPTSPAGDAASDVSAAGVGAAGHRLLGACVALPDSDAMLFTGSLSVATHPWLADHTVSGTVLLPGTALLELAIHAGAIVEHEAAQIPRRQWPADDHEYAGQEDTRGRGIADPGGLQRERRRQRDGQDARDEAENSRIWCRCPSTGTAERCWWPRRRTARPAGTWPPPGPFGWAWATPATCHDRERSRGPRDRRAAAAAGTPRGRGPKSPRAEAKENQTYCSKLIRSSQATPTETAKAAPA